MLSGYEAYCIFIGLKLHFSENEYDWFKYKGRTNLSKKSFENNKSKYSFYKLSRIYPYEKDLMNFCMSNFLYFDVNWVNDLLTNQADINYKNWLKRNQSLSYTFSNDIDSLLQKIEISGKTLDDLLTIKDGQNPELLECVYQNEITVETLIILNIFFGFMKNWEKKLQDKIVYPKFYLKCQKYRPFIDAELLPKLKNILKNKIKNVS